MVSQNCKDVLLKNQPTIVLQLAKDLENIEISTACLKYPLLKD